MNRILIASVMLALPAMGLSAGSAVACGGFLQPKCQGPLYIPIPAKPAPKPSAPAQVVTGPAKPILAPNQPVYGGGSNGGAGIVAGNTSRLIGEHGAGIVAGNTSR